MWAFTVPIGRFRIRGIESSVAGYDSAESGGQGISYPGRKRNMIATGSFVRERIVLHKPRTFHKPCENVNDIFLSRFGTFLIVAGIDLAVGGHYRRNRLGNNIQYAR